MYEVIKALHNLIRWVVVLGGIAAVVTALQGLFTRASWNKATQVSGLVFTSALGVQLILGLWLYFISPFIKGLSANVSATMSDPTGRFFLVEHFVTMLLAVIIAQLGYSLSKRAEKDRAKFLRASIGYVVAALLIAWAIPWNRPLLPF